MNFLSSLTNDQLPLVIDTSVLISIHSCSYGKEILSAIPNRIIVPSVVAGEFRRGTEELFLTELAEAGIVEIHDTNADEDAIFERLITTLDDGESATIAIAINRNVFPIIDERKGRAHAISMTPALEPGWSLDLIRHPSVVSNLGSPNDIEALYLALVESHMRIPEERTEEIIALIGEERAMNCTCLPGYGRRFGAQLVQPANNW